MAEAGAALIGERARFCDRLKGLCHDLHHRITGGKEDLSLRYVSAVEPEDDMAAQLTKLWADARPQDLRLGASYYLVKPLNFQNLSALLDSLCLRPLAGRAQALLEAMGAR